MAEEKRGYMERLEALEAGQKVIDRKLNTLLMSQSVVLNEFASEYADVLEYATSAEEKLSLMLTIVAMDNMRDECTNIVMDGNFTSEESNKATERIYKELIKMFK